MAVLQEKLVSAHHGEKHTTTQEMEKLQEDAGENGKLQNGGCPHQEVSQQVLSNKWAGNTQVATLTFPVKGCLSNLPQKYLLWPILTENMQGKEFWGTKFSLAKLTYYTVTSYTLEL